MTRAAGVHCQALLGIPVWMEDHPFSSHLLTGSHRKNYLLQHSPKIDARVFLCVHTSVHIYTHIYMHLYIYTHIHASINTYIHTFIHIYIHTSIHIHTYIHLYIYIYTSRQTHCVDVQLNIFIKQYLTLLCSLNFYISSNLIGII